MITLSCRRRSSVLTKVFLTTRLGNPRVVRRPKKIILIERELKVKKEFRR